MGNLKIADLSDKLQALKALINQLREQVEFQPTLPTDPLDKAVMEVIDLTSTLADAISANHDTAISSGRTALFWKQH